MYFAVMTVVLVSVKGLLREYVKADEREEKAQGGLREVSVTLQQNPSITFHRMRRGG